MWITLLVLGLLPGCTPAKAPAPRLLVIGIDGLGVGDLERLDRTGRVPNLAALAREGIFTEVKSVTPLISPAIWASIASGKRPSKHGVDGWYSKAADGRKRVVDARDIAVRRYWEILDERGVTCNTFAWLSMYPVIPGKGVSAASDFLWDRSLVQFADSTSIIDGGSLKYALAPAEVSDMLLEHRIHPDKARASELGYQFPATPLEDHPMLRDQWALSAAVATQASHPADVVSVYVKGVDELSHLFLPFTDKPFIERMKQNPQIYAMVSSSVPDVDMPWEGKQLTADDLELGERVVDDYIAWVDKAIAPVLAMRGPATNVLIVSDHGMLLTQPTAAPNGDIGIPTPDHDPVATLIMAGPAFKQGARLAPPSLLDVTPTLLHVLGQPVGADMDGRVITEALVAPGEVQKIASYDAHPRALPEVPVLANDAEMDRLRALGYTQ